MEGLRGSLEVKVKLNKGTNDNKVGGGALVEVLIQINNCEERMGKVNGGILSERIWDLQYAKKGIGF